MKLHKKKLNRPFRHVYTEDDYKWIGKRKNYSVILRRKTEGNTLFWFIIKDTLEDGEVIYNSSDHMDYYDSLEKAEAAAVKHIDTKL